MKKFLALMIILPFTIAAMEQESEWSKVYKWVEKYGTITDNFFNRQPVTLKQVRDLLSIEIPNEDCRKMLIDFIRNALQNNYLQRAEEGQVDEDILAALYLIKTVQEKIQDPAIRGEEASRHYKEMLPKVFPDGIKDDDQDI